MSEFNRVDNGDCLNVLKSARPLCIDLIYLDPPFFTQKEHTETTRLGDEKYSFKDKWIQKNDYLSFMHLRLVECKRVLKETGSIFLHCDRNAVHNLKVVCDEIFGESNFRSEIIWTYKRWSNSSKNLLPAHQTILYYTKSKKYCFNQIFTDYSESTNIDQILQNRTRDGRNKSVYAKNEDGSDVQSEGKKGVPLGDVWEIPYLNPKAKERVNYPTQKPVLLLERIVSIASNEGDVVLDPFCGSGTTLVAAKLNNRNYWGIDESSDAVRLSNERLLDCVKTNSNLLLKGRSAYQSADKRLSYVLNGVKYKPVHRNKGMDAVLEEKGTDGFTFIRLQKENEDIEEGIALLKKAMETKGKCKGVFVVFESTSNFRHSPKNIKIIHAISAQLDT